ncbi:MAG: pyrroline-5-carboxylate reductase [Hydrogenibacillus sp.]|nr:pyrroline-5-carboxylate reductase [Hydrogenibacillus sp.]
MTETGRLTALNLIGAGALSEALIMGILEADVLPPEAIYVTNRSDDERLLDLSRRFGVQAVRDASRFPSALTVLAVKPKDVSEALYHHRPLIVRAPLLLSAVAGVPMRALRSALGVKPPLARAMTNTSAVVRAAVTVVAYEDGVPENLRAQVEALFSAVGSVERIPEEAMDLVTALSGSGPAYVYYLLEALTAAAAALGMSYDLAARLARQTVIGAGCMLAARPETPESLRLKIMSPGGTTEAALAALDAGDFRALVARAVEAAERRSKALAEQFDASLKHAAHGKNASNP